MLCAKRLVQHADEAVALPPNTLRRLTPTPGIRSACSWLIRRPVRPATPKPERVRMRLLAENGVPDAQPSKSLAMVIRSRVARCGFHSRLERQWSRMVSHHNGDNLPRRLDASWSSMGSIQSQPRTVGAHWSYTVTRAPRRRCWSPLGEVTTWSVSRVAAPSVTVLERLIESKVRRHSSAAY